MIELKEYIDLQGRNHFEQWFDRLDHRAALKVRTYLARIESGNTSNIKSVGSGVSECRISWGPGYRVYLGWDGNKLVILLGGGTKRRQQRDIEAAKTLWQEYKNRKRSGE